jgi:hypothetical protein
MPATSPKLGCLVESPLAIPPLASRARPAATPRAISCTKVASTSDPFQDHGVALGRLDRPSILQGQATNAGEYLALGELCRLYKKRYRDAADLYSKAFAADTKLAEQAGLPHRYQAACAAALAATGKGNGSDNLSDQKKAGLRQQAFAWLTAELAARSQLLKNNPKAGAQILRDAEWWQKDADLAGVRDDKELSRLQQPECADWRQLWAEVEALRRQARRATLPRP